LGSSGPLPARTAILTVAQEEATTMGTALADLGITVPVLAAPMAGGASTPQLVAAAGHAGSLGFLAAGYKTAEALAEQIAQVRAEAVPFGINLFVPNPIPVSPEAFRRYARTIQPEAEPYQLDLVEAPILDDDDRWSDKVELLLADPVPVVSFTFGLPEPDVVAALRKAGTMVIQTVTSADEARLAADAGFDALSVQASAAGGHSATLTPERIPPDVPITELLDQIRSVVSLPLLATGGLATPDDVAEVLRAGAQAAIVGTVLLRADESGASSPHKAALADPARGPTIITRAFTGRPARALRNDFTDRYTELAPAGYPALHHLTGPMRKAAAAEGNADRINLWAGTGHRHATAQPAAQILARLTEHL
jgi:NAD(P)H-dependent flavin oxidoreductase YrpB (nitropropane dioxygenase family)